MDDKDYEELADFVRFSWWFVLAVFIVGMAVGIWIGLTL